MKHDFTIEGEHVRYVLSGMDDLLKTGKQGKSGPFRRRSRTYCTVSNEFLYVTEIVNDVIICTTEAQQVVCTVMFLSHQLSLPTNIKDFAQ